MKHFFLLLLTIHCFVFVSAQDSLKTTTDTSRFNMERKLGDVRVRSGKPFIETQVDKVVLNVANDIAASGGNVFELIQKAPSVSVTNDESFNMSGRSGVSILIDGRPSQLSGKDLVNYLRSIPASLVDKVEIIANPSSRYEAQGNAGIINIRMKKMMIRGTNGSLSAAWTQSTHARKNIAGTFNHRAGRFNVNASAGAGKANQFTRGNIDRLVASGSGVKEFRNRTVDQDASENYNINLGTDWFISSKNTIGAIVQVSHYLNPMNTPGVTFISNGGSTDSSLNTINDNHTTNNRTNYNLNYKYEDTLGNLFNVDADHTWFRNINNSLVSTRLLNSAGDIYGATANDQFVRTGIRIYSIRADLTRQWMSGSVKLETGIKWNRVTTGNDLDASLLAGNRMVKDTGRTNYFDYKETMSSGYVTLSYQKGKWQFQTGLRGEHTVIRGTSRDLKDQRLEYPDSSYFNLFPTLFMRYALKNNSSLGLSYSRRLNRPTYQDLNPFEYIFDNYTRESGNPYLQPEFSQRMEISFASSWGLNVSAGVSATNNLMQSVSRQYGEITKESDYNVGRMRQAFVNLSMNRGITKWRNLYVNLSPFYRKYDAAVAEGRIDDGTWGMSWYANNSFDAGHGWKLQLSSWGNAATIDGIYHTGGLGSIDIGGAKSVLRDRLNLRLSVIDIFNTQRWKQRVDFADVNFVYQRKWESRGIRLQVLWKFGKSSYRSRERNLGSDEETNRIRLKD